MPERFQIKNDSGKILVWYLSETEEELNNQIILTDNEIIKLDKISNSLSRRSFLAIRLMLKQAGIYGMEYLENGKPIIENGFISISHSGNWLAVQFTNKGETGLDIEKIHPRILKIKDRFLSEKEITVICGDEFEKMILCWSAKESIFKKHGGDTVFFKEKVKILEIDKERKRISVKINQGGEEIIEELGYFYPDPDYVLVHTL